MVCRFVCRVIVIGLMWATAGFALSVAPPAVARRIETVHAHLSARVPPRLVRAHDKMVARFETLKDRLFE